MAKKISKQEYLQMVFDQADSNHLWLNAFECIRPTDELKMKIGEWVLRKLNNKENLIPSDAITSDSEVSRELAELTPMLYLRINKS